MLHFCCADNIMAMVLTMFSSMSLFSSLTCGGTHTEKKKDRKSQFLFTAQLLRKHNFSANFQRGKIWKIAHKNEKIITAVTQYIWRFLLNNVTHTFFMVCIVLQNTISCTIVEHLECFTIHTSSVILNPMYQSPIKYVICNFALCRRIQQKH